MIVLHERLSSLLLAQADLVDAGRSSGRDTWAFAELGHRVIAWSSAGRCSC